MTNVTLKRALLAGVVKGKTDEQLEEMFSMFGLGVEKIDKHEIVLEVPPNRPDLYSSYGIIRALRAFLGKSSRYSFAQPLKFHRIFVEKSVAKVRPYTACAIVENLRMTPELLEEIILLQERLHATLGRERKKFAIGVYPLESISMPITYTAKKPNEIKFKPLDSKEEMRGDEILAKHETGRKYAHLLAGFERYPVFIDANGKILSMPPIINSEDTGKVTTTTSNLFIECSGFDFELLNKVVHIICSCLAEAGGKLRQVRLEGNVKELTPISKRERWNLPRELSERLLGMKLSAREVGIALERMEHEVTRESVQIAPWRVDVLHEVDLVEDVGIGIGFSSISPQLPSRLTLSDISPYAKFKEKIRELLVGLEMNEVVSYHLVKESELGKSDEQIYLESSKSEYKALRPSLLLPMLRIISSNKDHAYPQKMFEIGDVFRRAKSETGLEEREMLIVALSPANFTQAKQVLDYLFSKIGLEFELEEHKVARLIEERTGKVVAHGQELGYLGELHPETLRKWLIKMPVAVFEIDLRKIFEMTQQSEKAE
ncbi:phenylalanine--tRNA ligase subunit beta [Candidatus Pacearchaeota archaeon]|nr:MAG: phenylalanine--tRNA ligase subunit beta [Candidatus Pacearchaeota archaeon]